jgi:hypothetical protein
MTPRDHIHALANAMNAAKLAAFCLHPSPEDQAAYADMMNSYVEAEKVLSELREWAKQQAVK